MLTKRFWKDAFERVISTAAQAAIGAIGATAVVQDLDWKIVAGATGIAALLSFLKAIAATGVGNSQSASLVE